MVKDQKIRNSSSSGDALFEAAMRGAKPLRQHPTKLNLNSNSPIKDSVGVGRALAASEPRRPASSPGSFGGNLDKRTANRLRRGQVSIEGRLDLHGCTQVEAHRAVNAFLFESQQMGRHCVLIITGKGSHQEPEDLGFMPNRDIGVLRRNLPRWLAESPVREMVLHLEPAHVQHGGDGAFYVLLRRKR